jgi:DNA-binding response OmpR family regulator
MYEEMIMGQEPHGYILLTEDYIDTHPSLIPILEDAGYFVTTAKTSSEAIKIAELMRLDLFILDSIKQDGSVIPLCRSLRNLHPYTPIMFYTGATQSQQMKEAIEAGADAYLIKPKDLSHVMKVATELIGRAKRKRKDRLSASIGT